MKDHIKLARWFIARSDIEAALKLLEYKEDRESQFLVDYIHMYWPVYFGEYNRVYSEAGQIEAKVIDAFDSIVDTPRYGVILDWAENLDSNSHILDFGCSRGLHSINIHDKLPLLKWMGIDIDSVSIIEAKKLVRKKAKDPNQFYFKVGTEQSNLPNRFYDALMVCEVLEHVIDLQMVINELEKKIKIGGKVLLTMPIGIIEYWMWVSEPYRNREHVRCFDQRDLFEIFGKKPSVIIKQGLFKEKDPILQEEMGIWIVTYEVDGKPVGSIDWTRKLSQKVDKIVSLPI